MISNSKSCIICSKSTDQRPQKLNDSIRRRERETLRRFFELLGRHLNQDLPYHDHGGGDSDGEAGCVEDRDMFENLISAGRLHACEKCSKVVESFCDLYRKLKEVELILDWKVWTLQGLMCTDYPEKEPEPAGVDNGSDNYYYPPSNYAKPSETANGGGKEDKELSGFIIKFKTDLVSKCRRKLQATFPKVHVKKCHPQSDMTASTSVSEPEPGSESPFEMESLEESSSYGSRLRRVHRCPKCRKTFSNPKNLKEHLGRHDEEDEEFSNADLGSADEVDEGGEVSFDLDDHGGTSLDSQVELDNSEKNPVIVIKTESPEGTSKPEYTFNSQTRLYKCGHCSKHFRNLPNWESHYQKYGKVRYRCAECNIDFSLRSYYNKHRRTKHEGVRFSCDRCHKLFTARITLRKHQERMTCEEGVPVGADPEPESDANDGADFFDEESGDATIQKDAIVPIKDSDTQNYICPTCGKGFKHKGHCKEHQATVHQRRRAFKCRVCSKRFTVKSYLNRHRKTTQCATGVPPQVSVQRRPWRHCKLCGREFNRNDRLLEHLRKDHSPRNDFNVEDVEDPDKKMVMDKDEDMTSSFAVVIQVESPEEAGKPKYSFNPESHTYKCGHCSKQFRHLENWKVHYEKYSKVKFQCSLCKMSFGRRGDYYRHHRTAHGGQRFSCPNCDKLFTTKFGRSQHQSLTRCGAEEGFSSSKGPPQMYPCEICGKGFNRRGNLRHHVKHVHEEVKGHLCPHCGKGFSQLCSLKVHVQRLHSDPGEQLWLCDLCGKGFKVKGDLVSHRRKVHGSVKSKIKVEVD